MKVERKNLDIGQCFDQWIVISFSYKNQHYQYFWNCQCSCGYESVVEQSRLVNGRSTKCKTCANALNRKHKPILLDQQQYGKWLVLHGDEVDKRFVFVQCECGQTRRLIKELLLQEQTKCCGLCRVRKAATKHGHNTKQKKTQEYTAWLNAKTRVFNSNNDHYHNYGGRGITMVLQWVNSFDCFLKDVGLKPTSKHSLDRINNDGNYEPGNVRWALPTEQVRNRGISFKVDGEYLNRKKLARELSIHTRTIVNLFEVGFAINEVRNYSKLSHYQKIKMGESINDGKPYTFQELEKIVSPVLPSPKRHPLECTWHSMKQRCNNPRNRAYDNYGGRGIQVCDEWATFKGFLNSILLHIGEKPSSRHQLDRINNDGHYEIKNVRWSTPEEQSKNKRTTMYINGAAVSAQELALHYKMSRAVIIKLIKLEWDEVGLKFFEQLSFKQKKRMKIFVDQLSQDVAMQNIKAKG